MQVNRRLLFWGLLLVAIGGVLVTADVGRLDTATLADLLRLWPLAVIAVGVSIVLRRTRFRVPALLVAALVPGLVMGAAFAITPRFADGCGARGDVANVATEQGTFGGPARITIESGCGTLNLTTGDGADWTFDAESTRNHAPNLRASDRSLAIEASLDGLSWLDEGRNAWDLTLPAKEIDDLSLSVVAGSGNVDLPSAEIDRLSLTANAAKVDLDASGASVVELRAVVNAGSVRLALPADDDIVGSLVVNAGELAVCAPPDVGLRLTANGVLEHITVGGLEQVVDEWMSPNYRMAANQADLRVTANLGAIEINPIGGCA
jgi:hypothetical protein